MVIFAVCRKRDPKSLQNSLVPSRPWCVVALDVTPWAGREDGLLLLVPSLTQAARLTWETWLRLGTRLPLLSFGQLLEERGWVGKCMGWSVCHVTRQNTENLFLLNQLDAAPCLSGQKMHADLAVVVDVNPADVHYLVTLGFEKRNQSRDNFHESSEIHPLEIQRETFW